LKSAQKNSDNDQEDEFGNFWLQRASITRVRHSLNLPEFSIASAFFAFANAASAQWPPIWLPVHQRHHCQRGLAILGGPFQFQVDL